MKKYFLLTCFLLSGASLSPVKAMKELTADENPRSVLQRLQLVDVWEADPTEPWSSPIQNEKLRASITYSISNQQEEALALLEEGAKRGHLQFINQLGLYYRRINQPVEALKWFVHAHQLEFFTTFNDNNKYFTSLIGTSVELQANEYQKSFSAFQVVKLLKILAQATNSKGKDISKIQSSKNMALRMFSTTLHSQNEEKAFPKEDWLTEAEKLSKAYWAMRLIPPQAMDAECISELYYVIYSDQFASTPLLNEQKNHLKWVYFQRFCTDFLPKLPCGEELTLVRARPIFRFLNDHSIINSIDLEEYLLGIGKCVNGLLKIQLQNKELCEVSYLEAIQKAVTISSLEESRYNQILETLQDYYPSNLLSYVKGLFYDTNKIGIFLSDLGRVIN